jgi:hypothetical protein
MYNNNMPTTTNTKARNALTVLYNQPSPQSITNNKSSSVPVTLTRSLVPSNKPAGTLDHQESKPEPVSLPITTPSNLTLKIPPKPQPLKVEKSPRVAMAAQSIDLTHSSSEDDEKAKHTTAMQSQMLTLKRPREEKDTKAKRSPPLKQAKTVKTVKTAAQVLSTLCTEHSPQRQ